MEETNDGDRLLKTIYKLEIGYVIFGLIAFIIIAMVFGDPAGFTLHWR